MPNQRGMRVLIIDDNIDNAETLRMFFRAHGHDAATAYSGPEGLRLARERSPHAVVCDIGLPGLSGIDVAGALRRDQTTAGALLVAITGHGGRDVAVRCREAGFRRTFLKPVDPNELLGAIADAPRASPQPVACC